MCRFGWFLGAVILLCGTVLVRAQMMQPIVGDMHQSAASCTGTITYEPSSSQDFYNGSTGVSTLTTPAVTAAPACSTVLLTVEYFNTPTFSHCTDNKSNSYTQIAELTNLNASGVMILLRAFNVQNGPTTFTCSWSSGTATYASILEDVFINLATSDPLDHSATNNQTAPGTATDAVTTGTITVSQSGELIYGILYNNPGNGGQYVGTGETAALNTGASEVISEYKTANTSVASTWTATNSSDNFWTIGASLKP